MFAFGRAFLVLCCLGSFAARASSLLLRDGQALDGGYFGTSDVAVTADGDTAWDSSVNYDAQENQLDGDPGHKGVLIRWDLSSVPPNTAVQSAALVLEVTNSAVVSFEAYELLRPWDATQATWNNATTATRWTLPGAQGIGSDRGGAVLTSLTGALGSQSFPFSAPGVAAVQRWVSQPATNRGLAIQNYSPDRWDGLTFRNFSAPAAQRPKLTIVSADGGTFSSQSGTDTTLGNGPRFDGNANRIGLSVGRNPEFASMLAFDLAPVPRGSKVVAGKLLLYGLEPGSGSIPVRAMRVPWTEAGASWSTYDGTHAWGGGGQGPAAGDFGEPILATLSAAAGPQEAPLTDAGVALLQSWLDGAQTNLGFALVAPSVVPRPYYGDREDPVVAHRPGLLVDFLLPAVARLAPASQGSPPGEVTLDGRASTPAEQATTLLEYVWRQTDGPLGVRLASGPSQRLTLTEPGRYAFELVVVDDHGGRSAPAAAEVLIEGEPPRVAWRGGCGAAPGGPGLLSLAALVALCGTARRRNPR